MVRRGVSRIQGETPIQFLNKIQKVGYCLNPFTITVAETLWSVVKRLVSLSKMSSSSVTFLRQGDWSSTCNEILFFYSDPFKKAILNVQ